MLNRDDEWTPLIAASISAMPDTGEFEMQADRGERRSTTNRKIIVASEQKARKARKRP
jgi:hypothetical protein